MPTVAERIVNYLTRRPVPMCDDRLAKARNRSRRQQAQPLRQLLGATDNFNRYSGACADHVGEPKMMIRLRRKDRKARSAPPT